ncbi:MAG TPA: hypothetical protein VJB09_02255 [Candidatus Paceibacterota bacterium]
MKNNKGFVGIFIVIGILIAGGATYALVPRSVLKSFFQTGDKPNQEKKSDVDADVVVGSEVSGDKPTETEFKDVIDSSLNLTDDRGLTGLKEYNPTKNYQTGDTAVKSTPVYQSEVTSPDQKDTNPNTDQPSDAGASTSTNIKIETETGASTR